MEENKQQQQIQKCDGHCETCNINQRTYCAAQIALYNQEEIAKIKDVLDNITAFGGGSVIVRGKVSEIEEKRFVSEPTTTGADE